MNASISFMMKLLDLALDEKKMNTSYFNKVRFSK